MNLSTLTEKEIYDAIEVMQNGIAIKPNGAEAQNLRVSIDRAFAELDRRTKERAEKKSQDQPIEKTEQLQENQKEFFQKQAEEYRRSGRNDLAEKVEQDLQNQVADQEQSEKAFENEGWEKVREALPAMARAYDETIKTIKAPAIDREPEYINIELTDQKGAKYIRTYNRAQVKSLCRKYFSNIHSAWLGGNRKLTNGFDNLLAYFLGWAEFDGKKPTLQDVLQDYFRYKKASEKTEDSEAFKVAKELYDKIISVTQQ